MSIGSDVLTPWPISGFFATIVTVLSALIVMKAIGESGGGGAPGACANRSATGSTYAAIINPPPAIAVTRRNERRLRTIGALARPPYRSPDLRARSPVVVLVRDMSAPRGNARRLRKNRSPRA